MNHTIKKNQARTVAAIVLCAGLGACAHWTPAEQGTAIGGVTGAAVGNVITGGSALGTIGGAAIGGAIGHEVGQDQQRDRRYRR
jgi:osmotically inducible lipoprotein OsmB